MSEAHKKVFVLGRQESSVCTSQLDSSFDGDQECHRTVCEKNPTVSNAPIRGSIVVPDNFCWMCTVIAGGRVSGVTFKLFHPKGCPLQYIEWHV